MKTKYTLFPLAIASAVALNMTSNQAKAAYGDDLSHQVHRIDRIAHELNREFTLHYRHMSDYSHMRSDIAKVIARVHHIDGLTHDAHSSLRHISSDLRDLDRLAHHLHELVDHAEQDRHGHVHGNTRHVHELLSSLNGSIHSMKRTVNRMSHRGHDEDLHGCFRRESHDGHSTYRRTISRSDFGALALRFALQRSRY